MNVVINYMKHTKYVLLFSAIIVIVIIIAIVMINRVLIQSFPEEPLANQEGFTTYFRQTMRPHIRRFGIWIRKRNIYASFQ
jgi:hypothetical protein